MTDDVKKRNYKSLAYSGIVSLSEVYKASSIC